MVDQKRPSASMVVTAITSPEFKKRIEASLPKNVNSDRFTRMTITAIQNNPDLLDADKESLYLAILKCAETGLAPDGKEAALVVFNTKVGDNRWIKKVQFMPMVTGVIKKLGEVEVKCETEVVYEKDFFEYEAGDNPKITHRPAKLGAERGDIIGAYAILRMRGIDTPYREVMDKQSIEAVRAQSRAPNSLMWTKFQGEGYRKTVLRRCAKRIPMKFDESVERTLEADNETYDMETTPTPPTAETPAPDPTVVAAIEQVKPETDSQAVPQAQTAQPEPWPVQPPADAPRRRGRPPAQQQRPPDQPVEESENPAPRDATPPEPAANDIRTQANVHVVGAGLGAAPARPRGLAAVVNTASDDEDIF